VGTGSAIAKEFVTPSLKDRICEPMGIFKAVAKASISAEDAERAARPMTPARIRNWPSAILFGFRLAVLAQTLAVISQALLAGLALSGNAGALKTHMELGGLALLASVGQLAFSLLLRRELPSWIVSASAGLAIGEGVQMVSGRLHLFALHLPLGAVLFAGLTVSSLWAIGGTPVTFDHPREGAPADAAVRKA
jgi:hypothetical protein